MRPTALVTGGARGIGRAIVHALAAEATVVAVDREFPEGASGARLDLVADVRDPGALQQALEQVHQSIGHIDWVIAAAGITRDRVSWKMSSADWDEVIGVNLSGAFHTARAALGDLRASTCGRLVFIGSINGLRGRFGQANYAAAKAGLVGLARSLASELARHGVTVNVIAPGFIDTAMTRALPTDLRQAAVERTPLRRAGHPEDVAAAVRFLCSDAAAFITGVVLPVDGGQLLGAS